MFRHSLILVFIFFVCSLYAQHEENSEVYVALKIEGEDTTYAYYIAPYEVIDKKPYGNKRMDKRYAYLKYHVKKLYPYAKLAGERLREYNEELSKIKSETKQKAFMKKVEKELMAEFGDQMRDLTVSQGRILIRLIDRETGDTSYELVKELRGTFSAFFWQSLARLFGNDLKMEFDPENIEEDRIIEDIIQGIEAGYI